CLLKTVHWTVFKGNFAAYCNKEWRSCSPLLEMLSHFFTSCSVSGAMRLRARGGDFAVC
ncbi:MAG: hypothetical protein HDT21_09170, partial [Ruminococcus sp.]|nr:hypothetical protein [Ruminococcus sp.]